MNKHLLLFLVWTLSFFCTNGQAQDIIELDTTTIKGNTELPKAMYVVPWQDKTRKDGGQQKLVLHNLYSDLFDPVMPTYIPQSDFKMTQEIKSIQH